LEQEGGHLARRLSGGGAVFHDLGNLNFTFIMCQEDYDVHRQLSVIETACKYAGINVERSGRNDLLANGHKFSGNAFYHSQGRAYHHGTLLVNADMDKLGRYLTPPKAKLETKGVASVRSRVINLQELAPELTCELLTEYMITAFGSVYGGAPQSLTLSPDQLHTISTYSHELQSWQWLYGHKLPFTIEYSNHFSWGSMQLQLNVESGRIAAVQVYSDAMQWQLADDVSRALIGHKFDLCHHIECLEIFV
jgi:lipoate-protein ligase A